MLRRHSLTKRDEQITTMAARSILLQASCLWFCEIIAILLQETSSMNLPTQVETSIESQYVGSPCERFYCSPGKTCRPDELNRPRCVCLESCPLLFHHVCGSDHVTYSSACELQRQACLTKSGIFVAYKDRCEKGVSILFAMSMKRHRVYRDVANNSDPPALTSSVTEITRPTWLISTANTSPGNGAETPSIESNFTVATSRITAATSPTTFENGNVPANVNLTTTTTRSPTMSPSAGVEETPIMKSNFTNIITTISFTSNMFTGNECSQKVCPRQSFCAWSRDKGATCVCFDICSKVSDPVCGDNYKTYTNECELWKETCMSSANITLLYKGRCGDGEPAGTEKSKQTNQSSEPTQLSLLLESFILIAALVKLDRVHF